jgi:fluoride exporter
MPPMLYFWIMLGSALGGAARYLLSGVVANRIGETFPCGAMLVNITGSFVIGFFATLTGPDGRLLVGTPARQFLMIGFCGGYTTFSSFSLETLTLAQDGEWLLAGANAGVSMVARLHSRRPAETIEPDGSFWAIVDTSRLGLGAGHFGLCARVAPRKRPHETARVSDF